MSVKRREYRTQRHCLPTAAAGDKGALKEQSELQNSFTGNPVTNKLQASVAGQAVIIARRYYFIHSALEETYTDCVLNKTYTYFTV